VGSGWVERETYPRQVSRMLMRRSMPQPATRKTPIGGMKMVMRMRRTVLRAPILAKFLVSGFVAMGCSFQCLVVILLFQGMHL